MPMSDALHPLAPEHLPSFMTPPGETDVLMIVVLVSVVAVILMLGNLYLRLHALPERMAHRGNKIQFEIVAVLALLALFTHNNLFWVAALLLALIRIPDVWTPLARIADAQQKIAAAAVPAPATAPPTDFQEPPEASEPGPSAASPPAGDDNPPAAAAQQARTLDRV